MLPPHDLFTFYQREALCQCNCVTKSSNKKRTRKFIASRTKPDVLDGQVGLQVLLSDPHIFECHKSIADAVYNAEVGASLAMFKAGFTIDSFMLRYQGVDWTDRRNWDCNGR